MKTLSLFLAAVLAAAVSVTVRSAPDEWRTLSAEGLTFSIPAGWQQIEGDTRWGELDDASHQGLMFSIDRDHHPERILRDAKREGAQITEVGPVDFGSLPAKRFDVLGEMEGAPVRFAYIQLEPRLPDGDFLVVGAAVIRRDPDAHADLVEKLLAGVSPTAELVELLTGEGERTGMDGFVTVTLPNNWTEHYSEYLDDTIAWRPPEGGHAKLQLAVGIGRPVTGDRGTFTTLIDREEQDAVVLGGMTVRKFTGKSPDPAYVGMRTIQPNRTVYLLEPCTDEGERMAVTVTGTEELLARYAEQIERALASLRLQLPEASGPCDEWLQHDWQQKVFFSTPRAWKGQKGGEWGATWRERDLSGTTGFEFVIVFGNGEPPRTDGDNAARIVGKRVVAGFPATIYERAYTTSQGKPHFERRYILDHRVPYRFKQLVLLEFRFVPAGGSRDALPEETVERILASLRIDPAWAGEPQAPVAPDTEAADAKVEPVSGEPTEEPPAPVPEEAATEPVESAAADPVVPVDDPAGEPAAPDAAVEPAPEEPPEPPVSAHDTEIGGGEAAAVGGGEVDVTVESAPADADAPGNVPADAAASDTAEIAAPGVDAEAPSADSDAGEATTEDETREAAAEPALDAYQQATALRAEGAALQGKGRLNEALEKYRRSVELYPDARLSEHIRLIEDAIARTRER